MNKKNISRWLTGVAACGLAAGTVAAPFSVSYSDTMTAVSGALSTEVIAGQLVTVQFILDNGGGSAANQAWSAANLKCVVFTFNNAQDRFVAIDYSSSPLAAGPSSVATGSFTTNGAGQLQAGLIDWEHYPFPIPNPFVTNLTGVTFVDDWFVNQFNHVVAFNNGQTGFVNVVNNGQVANWSNPVVSNGVCSGGSGPPPPPPSVTSQSIPTLGEWSLIAMSALVCLLALARLSGVPGRGRRRIS